MEALKKKILAEGEVYEGNILKVDCFLNHQIDFPFMKEVGREFHRLYKDAGVNKILTIEASGIAVGSVVALEFACPLVFAKKSKRYVSPEQAEHLKSLLAPGILAAGVFVNEPVEAVAELLDRGVIDVAQLHGSEDDDYIARLRALTGKPIFRAFKVKSEADLPAIESCAADLVLLDSGAGTGKTFDWSLVRSVQRPYFLAGGLDPDNIADAIAALHPYGVDVSSGIETDGVKDESKMAAFVAAARKEG